MRWIISFPCWGNDHRATGLDGPLHSIFHALKFAGIDDALFIVNTDWLPQFQKAFEGQPHEVRYSYVEDKDFGPQKYDIFGNAHRQAIDLAEPGDRVALLCGDMTVSEEAFVAGNRIFDGGQKIIMAAASSTYGRAPFTSSRKLLEWSLDNLTPMCRDLFWHEGKGSFPWCVYFRHKNGVDFRGFHLHPFAVVKHEGLTFEGNTSDLHLSLEFPEELVHVVTDADELALVERSPKDRSRPKGFKVRAWTVVSWVTAMGKNANDRHVWHFSHQINLKGEPDPMNPAIANEITDKIKSRRARVARLKNKRGLRMLRVVAAERARLERVWGGA